MLKVAAPQMSTTYDDQATFSESTITESIDRLVWFSCCTMARRPESGRRCNMSGICTQKHNEQHAPGTGVIKTFSAFLFGLSSKIRVAHTISAVLMLPTVGHAAILGIL